MSSRRAIRRAVAVTALLAGLAACGGDGVDYVEPAGPADATVELDAGNFYFEPENVEAPAGIVEIEVTNVESGEHTLVIEDVDGFRIRVPGKGDTDALKVELAPGTYEFWCDIPGHRSAGMEGELVVE
ncbi:MAG: cupredoxin domain-containing protein [Acidimicrobiia bacterium]|nr:cupredoxin domain-containing protein [Acidimicrobiia bacterium]